MCVSGKASPQRDAAQPEPEPEPEPGSVNDAPTSPVPGFTGGLQSSAEQKAELVLQAQADLDEQEAVIRQNRRLSKGDAGLAAAAAAAAKTAEGGLKARGGKPHMTFSVSPAKDGPLMPVPAMKKKKNAGGAGAAAIPLVTPDPTPPVTPDTPKSKRDSEAGSSGGEISLPAGAEVDKSFNAHQHWAPSFDFGGFEPPPLG